MWDSAEGGGYAQPNVRFARFNVSGLTLADQGAIWSADVAWGYPSAGTNDRGDVAGTIHYVSQGPRRLPQGAPTSPALTNLLCRRLDRRLSAIAGRLGFVYTRYADDLTFSGEGKVTDVLPFVTDVLRDHGFELDRKKTNIFRKGRRQVVTGLVVNERPNLVRTLRRRLRAAVHHRANGRTPFWHGKPMDDGELLGRIAFLGQTQPAEAASLRAALGPALAKG